MLHDSVLLYFNYLVYFENKQHLYGIIRRKVLIYIKTLARHSVKVFFSSGGYTIKVQITDATLLTSGAVERVSMDVFVFVHRTEIDILLLFMLLFRVSSIFFSKQFNNYNFFKYSRFDKLKCWARKCRTVHHLRLAPVCPVPVRRVMPVSLARPPIRYRCRPVHRMDRFTLPTWNYKIISRCYRVTVQVCHHIYRKKQNIYTVCLS